MRELRCEYLFADALCPDDQQGVRQAALFADLVELVPRGVEPLQHLVYLTHWR
jgi:hypothetical protein